MWMNRLAPLSHRQHASRALSRRLPRMMHRSTFSNGSSGGTMMLAVGGDAAGGGLLLGIVDQDVDHAVSRRLRGTFIPLADS